MLILLTGALYSPGNSFVKFLERQHQGEKIFSLTRSLLLTSVRLFVEKAEKMNILQKILDEANHKKHASSKYLPTRN